MDQIITTICDNFVFSLIAGCFLLSVLLKSITTVITTSSREKSRREIAAYIAEGSITPEQGERLVKADVNRGSHA